MCRRGSASIAAESGRQESSDNVQTARSQTTPRTSEKSSENYTKSMCRKSSPNRSGTLRLAKIALGRFLERYFGRPKCARASPRAVLGSPGVAKNAWKTFPGAPRTFKNAPGKLQRCAWSPFVLASAAQDARGSIFGSFRDQISMFFRTLLGRFSIVFCDCSLIAFRSLFRSVSWSRVKNSISAEA